MPALEDNEDESPHPLLACGHRWNGVEDWADMSVILHEEIVDPKSGALVPAYSTGHWCRLCRSKGGIEERRLGSIAEADAWLRWKAG